MLHTQHSYQLLPPASCILLQSKDEPKEPHNDFLAGHDDFSAGLFDVGQALNEPDNLDTQYLHKLILVMRQVNSLKTGASPMPPPSKSPDDWTPYWDHVEFETAEFLYMCNQMSAGDINVLLDLWAATLLKHNDKPPFVDCHDLHKTINSTPGGVQYTGEKPEHNVPPWMDPHEVIQNMLANPDYATEMDYQPYREFSTDSNERQWQDFMSCNWAWNQADIISKDPDTTGSTFVLVILGSEKTTVSVATGANDYYPLGAAMKEHASCPKYRKYRQQLFHSSISKILANLRPGMTKPEVVHFGDGHYRQYYEEQVLLACIVRSWCPRCMSHRKSLDSKSLCRNRDHTEALIEEVTSTDLWDEYGIINDLIISHASSHRTAPFTNDFPRADIHKLIAPDLLHQLIKGTFKDHLVEWVGKYLHHVHGKKGAEKIQDDIDRRIAAVASFSGLRRFPQGRGFKQWTGDDSKALMKVYLPAIEGHVPTDVVCTFRAFLEFCYLVWHNIIMESILVQIQDALNRFHHYRKIFESMGVVLTFSLPRQHSCSHYILLIRQFGAPNGLCSSITKTKHIKAVKEPWRCSSRYKALGQMLVTNQCLDKLAASCVDFKSRGMLNGTCLLETLRALKWLQLNTEPNTDQPDQPNENSILPLPDLDVTIQGDNEEGEIIDGPTLVQAHVQLAKTPQRTRARTVPDLSAELTIPHLYNLLHQFLFEQVNPDDQRSPSEVPLASCPRIDGKIQVFNSASLMFYAPSDRSRIGGMRREHIHACPLWRNKAPQYDCVFVNTDAGVEGMRGMDIACVMCFFSLTFEAVSYPCAVVHWFNKANDDRPDEDTGMWIVHALNFRGTEGKSDGIGIIHIDYIYHAAHLIPIYGTHAIPQNLKHYDSYDAFRAFYINKFADHHAFKIAS
ncbi:uncharacterized protein EDB91DRAFT_1239630 [Suillus paluster]|uniref:uncharacterized protein n=1 Tax=Suillus paluster TaxID=48578 RepID=UPI001B8785B7|nr:uncharacterized protein EDB91DRAFT_1239630 [Suillus paluster]KAG1726637.1 hypothetical protein EDB91DRAFT_1239630 [Suillus paluster]